MVSISKPKLVSVLVLASLFGLTIIPLGHGFTYSGTNLPSNTIYFDDFSNYVTPSPCTTAALACLPGWGAYDNATGGIANITTWHPLASSGKSMLMGSSTSIGGKFDRHRSWAIMPGQTRVSVSQWFQFSQNALQGINQNEIHFSIEMADGTNFHECVQEFFTLQIGANQYISINDGVFNYNMSLNAWDRGGFNGGALNGIWDNNQWHYEKITMDISNPTAPTCPYMQMDSIVFSSLNSNQGWRTTFNNKVNYQGTGSVATTHGLGGTYTGQIASLPWRLEIATISAVGNPQYYTWHTNILITDDSPGNPTIVQFGLTAFSSWYPVLIVAIGVLYGTSGIGLARRVILGKTEGMLSNYKMIFLTGLIASIGFILILVLGSFATQQVCNNTNGATCNY